MYFFSTFQDPHQSTKISSSVDAVFFFFYVVSSPAVVEKNILKKALAPDSSFQMYYKHKKSSEIEILK